jgi:hypothetical protein
VCVRVWNKNLIESKAETQFASEEREKRVVVAIKRSALGNITDTTQSTLEASLGAAHQETARPRAFFGNRVWGMVQTVKTFFSKINVPHAFQNTKLSVHVYKRRTKQYESKENLEALPATTEPQYRQTLQISFALVWSKNWNKSFANNAMPWNAHIIVDQGKNTKPFRIKTKSKLFHFSHDRHVLVRTDPSK